jgi:type I restriction enzyme S subunit
MKNGWQVKRLYEVSDIFDGPHATPKTVDSGPIFLGISALQDGVINLGETRHVTKQDFEQWTRRVRPQPNDVVFSYETRLGQAAIIPKGLECCLGRRMGLVRFRGSTVVPAFFLYQYLSPRFREFLDSKTIRGATVDRISIRDFPSFPIAVPPLPEQQRIVGILDEAFEGIATAKANAQKNLQNARAIFESHLQSVFTQRGKGWVEKTLGEMCERITKGSSPKWQGIAYVDAPGILFVTSENVGEYRIILDQPKYVDEKFNIKDKKSILMKGDVLTNIVGASIGRTAVFDSDDIANINQAVCLIRGKPDLLNNYFLANLLNSPVFKQILHDNEVDNARANLSLTFFSLLAVPTPPLPDQMRIVAELDALREETERLASLHQRKLSALDALKKSLLQQAFTGEL